jgi:hypothetical protein
LSLNEEQYAAVAKRLAEYGLKIVVGDFVRRDGSKVPASVVITDPARMLHVAAKQYGYSFDTDEPPALPGQRHEDPPLR